MVIEVGAKVGSGIPVLGTLARVLVVRLGPMGTLTQVLDVGLGGRGMRRCAVAALSVWATLTVRDAPELTCTCLLHERKRELLVVVKVVQDVVIRISKGSVGRGLGSGHEDRLQDIVKGEVIEVAQSQASFIDFSKVFSANSSKIRPQSTPSRLMFTCSPPTQMSRNSLPST
jgi:hypothetical protein